MNINDSTGVFPHNSADYSPYLIDGVIVWIHNHFFDQTRTIQFPFQKIKRLAGDHVWIELV
jgi:hypothetical protein